MNGFSRKDFGLLATAAAAAITLTACTSTPASAGPPPAPTHPLGPVKQVDAGDLNVRYAEAGSPDGQPVILLHGWPHDIHGYADVTAILAAQGFRVIVPYLREFGTTRFWSTDTVRNGQQAALAHDVIALMDALNIPDAILGGYDWGGRTANAVAALWPKRCTGLVAVSGYILVNLNANLEPPTAASRARLVVPVLLRHPARRTRIPPQNQGLQPAHLERRLPIVAIRRRHLRLVCDLVRKPRPRRHRHPQLPVAPKPRPGRNWLRRRRTTPRHRPAITVPTITIGSDFDGTAKDGNSYRALYTGPYEHRVLDGIGHNVPQEAPQQFATAIAGVARI